MDLLDLLGQEAGDQAQAHYVGMRKLEGGKTPSVLLARMPSPINESAPAAGTGALLFSGFVAD
jgi:hypothetical protein